MSLTGEQSVISIPVALYRIKDTHPTTLQRPFSKMGEILAAASIFKWPIFSPLELKTRMAFGSYLFSGSRWSTMVESPI